MVDMNFFMTFCRQMFSAEDYQQKMGLCQDQLAVMDKLEPGLTKSRGRLLYELADSTLMHHNAHYQNGELSAKEFAAHIQLCIQLLSQAIQCLRLQSPGTFDFHVLKSSHRLTRELQNFKAMIS